MTSTANTSSVHTAWLDHAARLAQHVDPHATRPNPRVGCVVVRDGHLIAQGAHTHVGGPHAEAVALHGLTPSDVQTATVYITLEPCAHFTGKRTPACVGRLTALRPAQVIVGSLDPTWSGANLAHLRQQGVAAHYVQHTGCHSVNRFWLTATQQQRPYLTVKIAQSLAGQWVNPHSPHITSATTRQHVHELRAQHDTILTTPATIIADNPQLNVRLTQSSLLHPHSDPDLIIFGNTSLPRHTDAHTHAPRTVHHLPSQPLADALIHMYKLGYRSLMTECGPTLCSALIDAGLANEIQLHIASNYYHQNINKNTPSWPPTRWEDYQMTEIQSRQGDLCLTFHPPTS